MSEVTESGARAGERARELPAPAAEAGAYVTGSVGGARGRPHLNNRTAFCNVTQIPQPSGIHTASQANAISAPEALPTAAR